MTKPFVGNIKKAAKESEDFRHVLVTGRNSQLVLMCLQPGEAIGDEVHEVDQIIYVVDGEGKVVLDGDPERFQKGDIVFVPAGTRHNVYNTEEDPLKLFTVYAPPQHAEGTVHQTKADSMAADMVGEPAWR